MGGLLPVRFREANGVSERSFRQLCRGLCSHIGWKAASPLSGRDYSKLTFVHFPTRRQCVCNAHRFVTVDDVKRICQELEPIVLLQDA
jgi:hypothetical protein